MGVDEREVGLEPAREPFSWRKARIGEELLQEALGSLPNRRDVEAAFAPEVEEEEALRDRCFSRDVVDRGLVVVAPTEERETEIEQQRPARVHVETTRGASTGFFRRRGLGGRRARIDRYFGRLASMAATSA